MRIFRQLTLLLLFGALALASPSPGIAAVDVVITTRISPPPLPVYEQPIIPAEGYLWMPGYWAWGPQGYYWVPGTWILPPAVGLLWTPGYWAWRNGFYVWHAGYWAPRVGFYGGINYGYGYFGTGYLGGYWINEIFFYNMRVNNVRAAHITHIDNRTIVNNVNVSRVSFNGGRGGIAARASTADQAFAREQHIAPTSPQTQHEHAAGGDRGFLSSVNHGRPTIAATPRAAAFTGHGIVGSRGANTTSRTVSPNVSAPASRPQDVSRSQRHPATQAGPAPAQGIANPARHDAGRASHNAPKPVGTAPHPGAAIHPATQAIQAPHPSGPAPQGAAQAEGPRGGQSDRGGERHGNGPPSDRHDSDRR
jgi:hypothetical protein